MVCVIALSVICGVMVSVIALSVVDRGFKSRLDQTKKTIKKKGVASPLNTQRWLARNQDNVSEWGDMSIR